MDGSGQAYVAGRTSSTDFPTTPGAFDTSHNGGDDIFVSKLSADGSTLLYSTFLGGISTNSGNDIAVDGSGSAYVTGVTYSSDFPTTPGAFDTSYNGGDYDVFVTKLDLRDTEVCDNGVDDDGDTLVDCDDPECCDEPVCFGSSICTALSETIQGQKASLSNVEVTSPDFAGTSTVNFTSLEFVKITTGAFAGKGFSKGDCEATLEGVTYTGKWQGVIFLNPEERRIYLKGAITGGITASVEGYLTESVPESGNYDKYQATWQIGRLGSSSVSATINISGDISYQGSTEYTGTDLYLLQDNIKTAETGSYGGDVNIVLTHLRVVNEGNPFEGEGFSIISYNSEAGSGQGWTYDRLPSPGIVQMKGLFSSPLFGIVSATLNDSSIPRTLSLSIERVDLALPPMADLEVRTWGPQRVSPGQTVDYMVEYRNDGVVSAEDAVIVLELPSLAQYISSTEGGIYRWDTHEAFWKLGTVIPGQRGVLSAKVRFPWGLAQGITQPILAKYCTSSEDKDYYLNPDRERLCYYQDYLDYQPLEINPEDIITQEAFEEELVLDPELNDLHQFAIELGYSDRVVAKTTLNDGSTLIVAIMANSLDEVLFLTKSNDTLTLAQYTETSVSIFDREGGMTWDLASEDSLNFWGEWPQHVRYSGPERDHVNCTDKQGCIADYCIANCINKKAKFAGWITGVTSGAAAIGCVSANNPVSITTCIIGLTGRAIAAWQLSVIGDSCRGACCNDPCIYQCDRGQIRSLCKGNIKYKEKCNKDGKWERVSEETCSDVWLSCGTKLFLTKTVCRDGECKAEPIICGANSFCNLGASVVCTAHDPNIKYGPEGAVAAGQKLDYRVEFENEGEGIAFGVYFTDILDEDLDDSTLVIGPVKDVETDAVIGPEGTYDPTTRTITWFVGNGGEVGPGKGGYAEFSVKVKSDAPRGTEIINYGTVYFPSVPEETRTNAIVSIIPANEISCDNGVDDDGDGLIDCDDPECFGSACPEVCDDGQDNDGDGFVDCADTDCPPCPEICDDGLDNDRDGLVDCADTDCPPCPDIKANVADGAINLGVNDNLSVAVSLATGGGSGKDADWWAAALTPWGKWYWFTLDRWWVQSDTPISAYGGPLVNIPPYTILDINTSLLPKGTYEFYFGVDMVMNGTLDVGAGKLYYDRVVVNITP